jgi:hypothetical protein
LHAHVLDLAALAGESDLGLLDASAPLGADARADGPEDVADLGGEGGDGRRQVRSGWWQKGERERAGKKARTLCFT